MKNKKTKSTAGLELQENKILETGVQKSAVSNIQDGTE